MVKSNLKKNKKAAAASILDKRLSKAAVHKRLAALLDDANVEEKTRSFESSAAGSGAGEFLTKARKKVDDSQAPRKKRLEIVGAESKEVIGQEEKMNPADSRSPAEAIGLKLLRHAVRNQSHLRVMAHHRPDSEYQLRKAATSGVVRLFNALSASQKIGDAEEKEASKTKTLDKAQEQRLVASRDAFFAALKSSAHNEQ